MGKNVKKKNSSKVSSPKNLDLGSELAILAKSLSGESRLRKQEEELQELKEKVKERQKNLGRLKVLEGEEVFDEGVLDQKKVVQNRKLFEWEAPIRQKIPFDPRSFLLIVGGCLVFIVLLAVLGNYGLMFAVMALLFFIYVAGTVEPINVEHSITMKGIESIGTLYEWFMLEDFWFSDKEGLNLLIVTTKLRVPGRLILLLDKKDRAPIFALLQDRLEYKDIRKQGRFDEMSYGKYISLENV